MELKIFWHTIQTLFAAAGGWVGWYLGQADGFLYALIAFTIIDYITGVLAAAATRQLSSRVGFVGIARKLTIFLLVGIANLIDIYLLKEGAALRVATIMFYLTNEGISLLENTTRLGLPVPPTLANALHTLGNHTNKQDNSEPEREHSNTTITETANAKPEAETTRSSTTEGNSRDTSHQPAGEPSAHSTLTVGDSVFPARRARHAASPHVASAGRGRHAARALNEDEGEGVGRG